MAISSERDTGRRPSPPLPPPEIDVVAERELGRWGGICGLVGVLVWIAMAVVVGVGSPPDASEPESLTDFPDIETTRLAENTLYFAGLVLFALHALVLYRLLRRSHPPAALFGAALAVMGFVMMASSALLHVSTTALSEQYTDPANSDADRAAIESAWFGAQGVFDAMLAAGVLLVPVGIALFGLAMRNGSAFGSRLAVVAIVLGVVGAIGAAIAIVDPGSSFSALGVLAMGLFHLVVAWPTMRIGRPFAAPRR